MEDFRANGLKIHLSVKNTGNYNAHTVLFLYIRDVEASTIRRVRELKDFQKLWIPKGGIVSGKLMLDEEKLSLWNSETPGDNNLCKIITVSKNLNTVVCVVDGDAAITGEIDSSPIEALLVIPADNLDNAESLVKEAVSNSQQFKSWLMDNNWITGLE